MIKVKFCGLSCQNDIDEVNKLLPEYIGFVFAPKSRRYISPDKAFELKRLLSSKIKAVGVFVNETPEQVADLSNKGIVDIVQLHGNEDEAYIRELRKLTDKPIMKAFRIETTANIEMAKQSTADYVLLDSGAGTGNVFDWKLIRDMKRPYFLAGGLSLDNVGKAIEQLTPYAVDVSSGIETNGHKDKEKMAAFIAAVRKEDKL